MIMPIVIFLLFLLGQFGRISFNAQEVNIYLYEIAYFGWVTFLIFKIGLRNAVKNTLFSLKVFLAVLVITYLIGIPKVSAQANLISFLYLLRLGAYLIAFQPVMSYFQSIKVTLKHTFEFFILFCLLLSGFAQYFLYNNLRNLQYLGWDPHLSRLFGQFFDTSIAGAIYGLAFLYLLVKNDGAMKSSYRLALASFYAIAGLLTYSRGFIVSMVSVLAFYYLIVAKKLKPILITLVIILLFVLFSPKPFGEGVNLMRTSTIESRLADYKIGLELWQRNPIFGIGYNRIRYFKEDQDPLSKSKSHAGASFHSSFLILLVTSGIVGLGVYLYLLFSIAKYNLFATVGVIFLSVYSLFDNILLHPFILFLLPLFIGLNSTSRRKP